MTAVDEGVTTGTTYRGLAGVPLSLEPLTRKDFTSDQEVRWCPGCGDYAVLAAFQGFMPELGIKRENTVIVSGIGCSSRFPYYVDSYGMHSIHGRATAIATGVATAREDVGVFVITGDGDALSIGGNHLIHVLRRNVNLTILLFNNRIYGLTKGQYSPTSEIGKVTKSTPMGSLDNPFNPVSLALGAEATFVARTIDSDRKHLTAVLKAAAAHRGTSLVEIYQNCPIFNDGAFDAVKDRETSADAIIPLTHGEPIRFGVDGRLGVVRDPATGGLSVAEVAAVGVEELVVHDAHRQDPSYAFALSRLTDAGVLHRSPIGIFRDVDAPTYDDLAREQVSLAGARGNDDDALQAMIAGSDTWDVTPRPVNEPSRTASSSSAGDAAARSRVGLVYGLAAYALWGVVPVFWPLVARATALEILAQRIIWSLVVSLVLLLTVVPRGWWGRIRSARLGLLALAAAVVSVNWGLYIWGVNHGHVLETALGYYINPILSILLGVLLLKERLGRLQWVAVLLAAAAVVVLTVDYGRPPWIALTLAVSFATYGFLKKKVNGGAVETLTIESAFLLLPALGYLGYLEAHHRLTFGHLGAGHTLLLMSTGLVTAVPLLSFAAASTRVPLSTLGLVQYVAPTAQFLLGVLYFHEDMSPARWIGFGCVWVALMLLTGAGLLRAGSVRRSRALAEPA